MAHVRQATIHDIAFVPALLCESFRDDPVLCWLIPETNRRHNAVVHSFRAVVQHQYLPQQQVYLTEDGSGVAVCLPAGVGNRLEPAAPRHGLLRSSANPGILGKFKRAEPVPLRATRVQGSAGVACAGRWAADLVHDAATPPHRHDLISSGYAARSIR